MKIKEFLILVFAIILLLVMAELNLRFYYWYTDKTIAGNGEEVCLKALKLQKNYLSTSHNNFVYQPYWDEDNIIGLIPRKNYTDGYITQQKNSDDKIINLGFFGMQHHNSQGLTNVEVFNEKKTENTLRIALFGDSFTCGAELPLKLNMGYALKELIPNIEVLNFCMIGMGIDYMYARYVLESKKFSPDIVIFNVLTDDLRRPFGCSLYKPNLTIKNSGLVISKRKWNNLHDYYYDNTIQEPFFESYLIKHLSFAYYNKYVSFGKNLDKGIQLFSVMIDELKKQTKEQNQLLIVAPIIEEEETELAPLQKQAYQRMINILKARNIVFFDSKKYFDSFKRSYNNQSFYYIRSVDHYKHFSATGNAVFAQGLKNTMESRRVIPQLPNYYFTNFDEKSIMYYLPSSNNGGEGIKIVYPFFIEGVDVKKFE